MIEIEQDTYYVGMWLAATRKGDFMCTMWLDPIQKVWVARYRFREHKDEKIFGSKDRKTWYEVRSTNGSTDHKLILRNGIDEALRIGEVAGKVFNIVFHECEGDGRKFQEILNDPHTQGVYVRHVDNEEEAAQEDGDLVN